MGFFLSTIKEEFPLLYQKLPGHSHAFSRVREYHGIFKSVCTDFLIGQKQFKDIFGSEKDLSFWGNIKTINALELFSGLAFYAKECSFKSKVRFLFMLFDFNEIKSISIIDLEYMLLSICDFTYKVLGKVNTKTDQLKLAEWLAQYFHPRKRVTVTRLYRLCAQAQELGDFLKVAGASAEEFQGLELINTQARLTEDQKQKFQEEEITAKLNWFNTFCSKLTKPKYKEEAKTNPHLSWVYGIEVQAFRKAFIALEGPVLIYAVSNKMVVFNEPEKCQLIYAQHSRDITAFCIRKSDRLVASAEGKQLPHVYIWNFQTLETIHIIRLNYSPEIHLMSLSEHQPLLAVIGQRENSPVLIFQTISWNIIDSLRLNQPARYLEAYSCLLPNQLISGTLQGCFVISGARSVSIVDQKGLQQSVSYESEVSALAISYLNSEYPYLRYFSVEKLCLFIVTGHKNGSVAVWQYGQQLYNQDSSQFQKYQIQKLQNEIIQLAITQESLFVCTVHQIQIHSLTALTCKNQSRERQPCRSLKLSELEHLRMMSHSIHSIWVTESQVCILSQQGDLVVVRDREVAFDGEGFGENETAYRVPNIVKFQGDMRALCFLQKDMHNILLIVSGGRNLMQIDPQTHEVELILNIQCEDFITVIDSAVTDEGTGLTVCGCRSGKLIIRNDWEEVGKVIECGSEIGDLKISPEANALLVATTNMILLIHLGSSVSSPRKLEFYNETPLTINFLDNSKFCAVGTSAKNVYLIELPGLKHRSVFKQVENFTASQLSICYPRAQNIGGIACPNILGGDMKFYLIGLQTGGFLYFPSMSSLERRNYLLLDGHCSPIANLAANADQSRFYTLGHKDSMLLEWTVQPIHNNLHKHLKPIEKSSLNRLDYQLYFKKIQKISEAPAESFDYSLSTFFVKGTKSGKLNRRLKLQLKLMLQSLSSEELALSKRHCNYNIQTKVIYGLQSGKINQIRYSNRNNDDSIILYSASRFIIQLDIQEQKQKIIEYGSKRIAFLELNKKQEVVWAQFGQRPWIWVGGKRVVQTTHQKGLLHFSIYKDFILSYGISNKSYTVNLHNIRTRKLIAQRTTDRRVASFLLLNEKEFVSISEVRRWTNFVQSGRLALASAAAILPNGRDLCLGGFGGELSVLCQNSVVEVARQAHCKEITAMITNQKGGHFELITASQDQTIKIWNQYFQQLFCIELKVQQNFSLLVESDGEMTRHQALHVCSLDCKGDKILAGFAHGQVWEFMAVPQVQQPHQGIEFESEVSLKSDLSQNQLDRCKSFATEKRLPSYKAVQRKLIDAHTCSLGQSENYVIFDVHSTLPLLATAGNDGRLIILDFLRNKVLANYLCPYKKKVNAMRFSPKGRMLIVGITGGRLINFYLNVTEEEGDITQLTLSNFQVLPFTLKVAGVDVEFESTVVDIEFEGTGEYFCASYWKQSKKGQSADLEGGHLKVFRIKSQINQNANEAFYQFLDNIKARLQDKVGSSLSKLVLSMRWRSIHGKHYIMLYSEYTENYRKPKHNGKYEVFCLEEKSYLTDEFAVDWTAFSFANLINIKTVGADGEPNQEKYSFTAMHIDENLVICGGMDGRIHLLRKDMLYSDSQSTADKQQSMCLSRTYNSHSTFITRIQTASAWVNEKLKRFVFVTAHEDQTLAQYQLIQQDIKFFKEHQPYARQIPDHLLHGQCLSKQHFYLMLNNRQPLREELTSVVEDVQKTTSPEIGLAALRIFGRRAFDRRYNLAYYQNNALYTIGPNIIIQSLNKPEAQELMKADPSPLSHYPQISSFHYQDNRLAVTTQEERSMLYIWDISSRSCLSTMQLECSVALMIRFSGDSHVILFGFNDRYETVVLLLNWQTKSTVGRCRLVHSGNWIIRDICTISAKGNDLQFVTCGELHLCYWELRGDSLVYSNFNSQPDADYLCVRGINQYIATGCESGMVYLWLNFQMTHRLAMHSAAVRCLQADLQNEFLVSGGKDGVLCFIKIQQNQLKVFNRAYLSQLQNSSQVIGEKEQGWKVQHQIQAIAIGSQLADEEFERYLVGTRSGAIYQIQFNELQSETKVKMVFQGHDHEAIIGGAFSTEDKNCFFTLSNTGIIDKWNFVDLKKEFSFDVCSQALKIQSFGSQLLVCLRNEIAVYRVESKGLTREQEFCIDTRRGENQGQSKGSEIVQMCFSGKGRILAVCIKICSKEPIYQINIYLYGKPNGPAYTLLNLKHEIDYLDFSTDDKYLLFKDRYEEIGMITLSPQYKRINTIFVEMNIQWQEEGLRISPHAQKIYYSYSCENKITAITKLGQSKIIIGDQMGTIRLFQYPCPDQRLGELHLQCYSNHMNDIHFIRVHPQQTHVLTSALQDRSLILWKRVQNAKEEHSIVSD